MEQWVPIAGYEGRYDVSSHGHVRRCADGIILRGGMAAGYPRVELFGRVRGRPKIHRGINKGYGGERIHVHVLVCAAFHGARPSPHHQVNHKNGVRSDNHADNLEWVTPSANRKHSFDVLHQRRPVGSMHGRHVLVESDVLTIRQRYGQPRVYDRALALTLATTYHVSESTIRKIVERRTWRHV